MILKKEAGGRTRTTVSEISGDERTEEIARMLSGAKLTDTSMKHAEQMIKATAVISLLRVTFHVVRG